MRKYKQPSFVSGKTVRDILSIPIEVFNKLNLSTLRKVVGRLVSAGNKRLRSFERANESSPAVRYVKNSGGVFSTKNKSLNELRAEYIRAKTFLQSKTGTRAGWKKSKKEIISGLKKNGVDVDNESFEKLWKSYERLKEVSPEVATKELKYSTLKEISDIISSNNYTTDEIVERVYNNLSSLYEERIRANDADVSGFFELK